MDNSPGTAQSFAEAALCPGRDIHVAGIAGQRVIIAPPVTDIIDSGIVNVDSARRYICLVADGKPAGG
jgi:hypothetical protein